MAFLDVLDTGSEVLPFAWKNDLIHYNELITAISGIVNEMQQRGLSAHVLNKWLQSTHSFEDDHLAESDSFQIKYYFAGTPPDIRSCIHITFNASDRRIEQLITPVETDPIRSLDGKFKYRYSKSNVDYFSLSSPSNGFTDFSKDTLPRLPCACWQMHSLFDDGKASLRQPSVVKDIPFSTFESKVSVEVLPQAETSLNRSRPESRFKTLIVELEQDNQFFQMLLEELNSVLSLQNESKAGFYQDLHELEKDLTAVSQRFLQTSPGDRKSDLYIWREIFRIYTDAKVFIGNQEPDYNIRAVNLSRSQLLWFMNEIARTDQLSRIKKKRSKYAYSQFISLNVALIHLKQFQAINHSAMLNLLKQHDKLSGLTALSSFPKFVDTNMFFSIALVDKLCATITEKLLSIVPQPTDYSCPVCLEIAWRPIRLVCGHIFCVRCLVTQQKRNMPHCPVCRRVNAVGSAGADQLDIGFENLITTYFAKEIEQKKKHNDRERAIEEAQAVSLAFTGRRYTDEQIRRMQEEKLCTIM